ncbi:MAG: cation diffusion facilitator family transporter [Candidatus Saccharibacteria bacterium]|nr:cation diffusion facilitator family transporter [Candidatus Saccharibacteria bacterium]
MSEKPDHGHHHHHHYGSSAKSLLTALILNLAFSVIELIGGLLTNSAAITSDSLHSFADAVSTGIAYLFERKKSQRYSIIGGFIVSGFLVVGSIHLIIEAIERIQDPAEVNYEGMMLFAVLGVLFNLLAALATMKGESFNQKTVNLHMLEDTFSWLAVLISAIIMKLTGVALIDPILSIAIALYILYRAIRNCYNVIIKKES